METIEPGAPPIDLPWLATQAMRDEGFEPQLSVEAEHQLAALPVQEAATGLPDLRTLLWSSIDNPDSRDLDQVEWAERLADDAILVRVGVADVDSLVKTWTPLDAHAARSTTSVYTGVTTFPMLPEVLSTDRTSLNPGEDRLAFIVEYTVNNEGNVTSEKVFRALLHNHAKLAYEAIGPWLEGKTPIPSSVSAVPGLAEQIQLQNEAAHRLALYRQENGALELETAEIQPVVDAQGKVVGLRTPERNQAHLLIENLMIAANSVVARFLSNHGVAAIERIVRPPERWPRIVALAQEFGEVLPGSPDAKALAEFLMRRKATAPTRYADLSLAVIKLLGPGEYKMVRPGKHTGHFGLATPVYTHFTAPNRRYPDLINQRLVKAVLNSEAIPYDASDLDVWAMHCTEREDAAHKVERRVRKVAAGAFLTNYLGTDFRAIVTFAGRKGVFVRLLSPPASGVEGRVVAGEAGLDVGNIISVRLVATDPAQGYIDFVRLFAGVST